MTWHGVIDTHASRQMRVSVLTVHPIFPHTHRASCRVVEWGWLNWELGLIIIPSFGTPLLPPSQIVSRLTFFTLSLTTRLIQKICANIVKFKSFLKNFY